MKKLIMTTAFLASLATTFAQDAANTKVLSKSAQDFAEQDPFGWMMAIIAMSVVFCALVILFLCFKYGYSGIASLFLNLKKGIHHKKQYEAITASRAESQSKMTITDAKTGATVDNDELAAAIGVALFMHEDGMHDQESGVLTLVQTPTNWTGAGNNQKKSPLRRF